MAETEGKQPERWEENQEYGIREAREERVVGGGGYLCPVMLKDEAKRGWKSVCWI